MKAIQLKAFRHLIGWRLGFFVFAGFLLGSEIFGVEAWITDYIDLKTRNLILYGIVALIVAVAYYCTIVCHELSEINEQLSGRSPEFKEWLSKRVSR
jgi:hypothetical protein